MAKAKKLDVNKLREETKDKLEAKEVVKPKAKVVIGVFNVIK